jgi:hypothetical protein
VLEHVPRHGDVEAPGVQRRVLEHRGVDLGARPLAGGGRHLLRGFDADDLVADRARLAEEPAGRAPDLQEPPDRRPGLAQPAHADLRLATTLVGVRVVGALQAVVLEVRLAVQLAEALLRRARREHEVARRAADVAEVREARVGDGGGAAGPAGEVVAHRGQGP